jgi:hypothetical protein
METDKQIDGQTELGKTQGSKKMGYYLKNKPKKSTKILTNTYLSILPQWSHKDKQTNKRMDTDKRTNIYSIFRDKLSLPEGSLDGQQEKNCQHTTALSAGELSVCRTTLPVLGNPTQKVGSVMVCWSLPVLGHSTQWMERRRTMLLWYTIMFSLIKPNLNTSGACNFPGKHLSQNNAQALVCWKSWMAVLH